MAALRDRVAGVLGREAIDATAWRDRLDDLLYEGETVVRSETIDDARVVVTSHRVLALTPGPAGETFQQVERPNVVRVRTGADADTGKLTRGLTWVVGGALVVGAGLLVDFEDLVGGVGLDATAGGQLGLGDAVGLVQTILELVGQLDEALVGLGALGMLVGAVFLGLYARSREPTLVIEVSGAADIRVPRPGDAGVADRLETAIAPGGPDGSAARAGHGTSGEP